MAQALQRSFVRLGQDPKVAISSMVNDDQVRALRWCRFPHTLMAVVPLLVVVILVL